MSEGFQNMPSALSVAGACLATFIPPVTGEPERSDSRPAIRIARAPVTTSPHPNLLSGHRFPNPAPLVRRLLPYTDSVAQAVALKIRVTQASRLEFGASRIYGASQIFASPFAP